MTSRETRTQLDWEVPVGEWDLTVERVRSEWGETGGYLGREVDIAMRERLDDDGYAEVENLIDRLVSAAGRRPTDVFSEKKSADLEANALESLADQDKDRVSVLAHAETAQAFKAMAQENGHYPGVELARALRARRLGGRSERTEQKLRRIVDDAEALLAETNDGDDASDALGTVEKRTIRICRRLGDRDPPIYEREEIREAIKTEVKSAPAIAEYEERVISRLGLVPFPENYDRLLAESKLSTFARVEPDAPAIDRLPWEALTREQKIEGIMLTLARRAAKSGNERAGMLLGDVSEQVFNGHGSSSHVRELAKEAAERDGFWIASSTSGKQTLQCNAAAVVSDRITQHIDTDASDESPRARADGGREQ